MKTPTTIHQAMMEDIIANPGDLSLRLMYADYLCDSNSEDYGEFIQLSIGAGKCYPLSEWEVRKWFGECLPEFHDTEFIGQQGTWWVVLKDKMNDFMTIELENGFIEGFRGTLQAFHDHGPRLCQHQPVVSIKITDRKVHSYHNIGDEGVWAWFDQSKSFSDAEETGLPPDIWAIVSQQPRCQINGVWADFRFVNEANTALSTACIQWARSQTLTD